MSLPSLPLPGAEGLPPIGLRTRQWIYLVLFVLVTLANCIDVFFDMTDPDSRYSLWRPWWLSGALRVLALLSGVGNLLALANARPTPAEQRVAVAKAELKANGGQVVPAGAPLQVRDVQDMIDDNAEFQAAAERARYGHEERPAAAGGDDEDDTREQPRYGYTSGGPVPERP